MMNIQSFILLGAVLALAFWALYHYTKKMRRTGGCGNCSCGCCDGCGIKKEEKKKEKK